MDADTLTPRLRMSRHSPVQYDRSSNLVSTSEAGPSRFPNFSQILDVDMKDMPLSNDQFSSSDLNASKTTTIPAATRSDKPAVVLRALLSRLPAHSPSPTQSRALSVYDATERESDFDTVSESNAAPSIAQDSLKHIFSNALREPGNTPQKARRRRNSIDASEVEASPRVEKERATNKGKRRSMSDDEVENTSQSINRRNFRLKSTPQPITMEFLRERFSDSSNLRASIEPQRSPPTSNHDSSNDTATILRDLNSSQATPPAATSTPQQSLRLSTSSRFQFHSNLLDQNSEMQKAIEGLDSYDEDVTHSQGFTSRAFNSSKTLRTSPVLRHYSSKSSVKPKPTPSNSHNLTRDQSHSMDDLRTPSQYRERFHADTLRSPSPAPQPNSHHIETNVISDSSRTKPSKDRSHSEQHLRSEVQSTSLRLSPPPRIELYRHHSPSSRTNSPAGSLKNHDDDYVDVVYERQRNWNSPHPIWHKPPPSPKGHGIFSASTPSPSATNGLIGTNGFRTSKHINEHRRDHDSNTGTSRISNSTTTKAQERPSRPLSPSPIHTVSLDSKPPKGLPDLPTPSSSDESDRESPWSNAANRLNEYNQSASLKWMSTPKPPGWLNTSKQVIEQSSPIGNVTQGNGDTPLATDDEPSYLKTPARAEATHGFQSSTKTPKPPGGWISTPAPVPQPMPVESPPDIPERNRGLLTPVASLSKGSTLEPKTPAIPGAWLATPAVKKSILKVRFEPEDSTLTDKLVESTKNSDPSYENSTPAVNGLDTGDDGLQRTEQSVLKSPLSPRRQKSPKSPKIRVLDAFGREQEPDALNQKCVNYSPSPFRVVDAMGHEINDRSLVEGIETAVTRSCSTPDREELLSRIRNGLDDLVIGIDDFDKDDQPLSIDHERVQQLTTISRRARGLRERLHSQVNSSCSFLSDTLGTNTSWFSTKPKVYIFLIILQLPLIWLMYRISFNRAQELFLNTYYDPFNPELHLYTFKSDTSLHVLRSEGARTTWSYLVGHIWDKWIHFIGSILRFWQAWDKGAVLQYDNTWTPT